MALSFIAATQGGATNKQSVQDTHTVSAGADRILIVAMAMYNSISTVTSATFGGVALTERYSVGTTQGNTAHLRVWTLQEENISTGSGTLSFTISDDYPRLVYGLTEYSGASQADNPFKNSTWDGNVGASSNSSETTSTDSDGLALGFNAYNGGADGGQTVRVDLPTEAPSINLVMNETAGDGGNKTMTFTHASDAFSTAANCLQVPQDISYTTNVSIALSNTIGAIDDGNISIALPKLSLASSATVGYVLESQLIEADMILYT
jgi:hypothetical protein